MEVKTARRELANEMRDSREEVVQIARRLVAVPSATPPGDTNAAVRELVDILKDVPGVELHQIRTAAHVSNLLVVVKGLSLGRRLIFNGHLDTFPLCDESGWSANPWGEVRDGRLYGLGVSDMKGGVAAAAFALRMLAKYRESFSGEAIGAFVGDEETASGLLGTQYLLDHVPQATGDAMICGDMGTPGFYVLARRGCSG